MARHINGEDKGNENDNQYLSGAVWRCKYAAKMAALMGISTYGSAKISKAAIANIGVAAVSECSGMAGITTSAHKRSKKKWRRNNRKAAARGVSSKWRKPSVSESVRISTLCKKMRKAWREQHQWRRGVSGV